MAKLFNRVKWKKPKNTEKYYWTQHVQEKMHYYGLSEQKVLGVIRSPKRIETGIVLNTVAAMIPVGNVKKSNIKSKWQPSFASDKTSEEREKWSQEIWVLYQMKAQSEKLKVQSINPKIRELQNKINLNKKITIISAWRYPGVSPKNNPIPEEILREIEDLVIN